MSKNKNIPISEIDPKDFLSKINPDRLARYEAEWGAGDISLEKHHSRFWEHYSFPVREFRPTPPERKADLWFFEDLAKAYRNYDKAHLIAVQRRFEHGGAGTCISSYPFEHYWVK